MIGADELFLRVCGSTRLALAGPFTGDSTANNMNQLPVDQPNLNLHLGGYNSTAYFGHSPWTTWPTNLQMPSLAEAQQFSMDRAVWI